MTELLIKNIKDNKFHRAVLPDGYELSLTIENPYLTKSSEYTSELELPLRNCRQNIDLFGHINRLDVTRRKQVMDAILIIDNRKMVVGSVTILECNESYVKIQLLGDNASVNFKNKYEKLFIDQMDLGSVFDNINPRLTYQDNSGEKIIDVVDLTSFKLFLAAYAARQNPIMGFNIDVYGDTTDGFVVLPAVNDYGEEVNKRTFLFWRRNSEVNGGKYVYRAAATWPGKMAHFKSSGTPPSIDTRVIDDFYGAIMHNTSDYFKGVVCPQPFIVSIIHRMMNAIGYNIIRDDINNSEFKYCYIPSTTETELINEMLPHWTLNDFMSEIENFFGVIFLFDEENKACSIVSKKEYYKEGQLSFLNLIGDNFDTTFDDDNQIDISNANVSFGMKDGLHKLDETIVKNAVVKEMDNYSIDQIKTAIINGDQWLFGDDINKVIATRLGRHFIKYRDKACECNELRDYKIDESESNIQLKIKPALLDFSKLTIIDAPTSGNNEVYETWTESYGSMMPTKWPAPICPKMGAWTNELNITEAIDYGFKEIVKPDYLPLALVKKEEWVNFKIKNTLIGVDDEINAAVYWGSTYGSGDTSDMTLAENNVALRLNPTDGMTTLYNQSIDVGVKIKGQVITKVNIYDKIIPQLDNFFIINGKRYICQKIEYKVNKKGIDPTKVGYFFEIE